MAAPERLSLAPERTPFPVEPRYLIRPDLRKLEPGGKRFVLDEAWPTYLRRKLELLAADTASCRVISGDESQVWPALRRVAGLLAQEYPEQCRVVDRGVVLPRLGLALDEVGGARECGEAFDSDLRRRVLSHLASLSPVERLADTLALAVQEDLVLMSGPPGGDSASMLHVCFPSHWNPADRAGASFARLHRPVPHNERLLAGSRNMVSAMLDKGPFIRGVWSITSTPHLDQNPARPHPPARSQPGRLIDRLYFRAERQTTTPLGGLSLFTIRIFVSPLSLVLDPTRAATMASAIRSMDAELLRYKSLTDVRDQLLEELDEMASR